MSDKKSKRIDALERRVRVLERRCDIIYGILRDTMVHTTQFMALLLKSNVIHEWQMESVKEGAEQVVESQWADIISLDEDEEPEQDDEQCPLGIS